MPLPSLTEIVKFVRVATFVVTILSMVINTPFFWFPFGTIGAIIIITILALTYGWLVGFNATLRIWSVGPRKFLSTNGRRLKPKILDDNRYGEHLFMDLKGIRIHYVSKKPSEIINHDHQIMLFLHGFPENWFSWRYQIEEFSSVYHTVAMSLRGYGDSDKPKDIRSYGIDYLIDDVYQMILKLTENSKHKRVILVAHDWGGAIAWTVALLYPELIEKMIIINAPYSKSFTKRLATDWKQFFSSWYMFFFQLPYLPELIIRSNDFEIIEKMFSRMIKDQEELDVYKHYFRTFNDISCPLNYYRAKLRLYGSDVLNKKLADSKRLNSLIEVPTLVIWGKLDNALVFGLAEESASYCRKSIVRYIDDGSHWVLFEKPNQVNQMMKEFLKNSS